MSDRSEIAALEHLINYVSGEAQRLRAPGLVLQCLRLAADELARAEAHAPTSAPGDKPLN